MKFEKGIDKRYRRSIEDAFDAIIANGNAFHRQMIEKLQDSDLLIRVEPVSKLTASGVTGIIDRGRTSDRIRDEWIGFREALGEIYIAIAEETIDTGGQRGCEGTFVHEGRHAYDFARTIETFSKAATNPLSIIDPTLYELELEAHKTAGEYMLCIGQPEYIDEGLQLMILCDTDTGKCEISEDGIRRRLSESYGLAPDGEQGSLASEIMGLRI